MLTSSVLSGEGYLLALTASDIFDRIMAIGPILMMIIGFSVVIFVHELGHFVMAKLCGVRVDKFAIGFGKEILGYTYGETRYSFNVLPLGGYVKMLGQEDFEIDKSGEWKVKDNPRSFTNKPVGSRMLIVSAGVIMNLVFAAIVFMVVFMVGRETIPARVGHILPGSPAHRAGLMPGDKILNINDSTMDDYSDVKRAIMLADADRPIEITVQREGADKPVHFEMEPEWSEEQKVRQIGIAAPMTLQIGALNLPPDEEHREDRLQVGDVLIAIDGVQVKDHIDVERRITDKWGQEVEVLVKRPEKPSDPDGPGKQVTCKHRAQMLLIPSGGGGVRGQHLLGLNPRARLLDVPAGTPSDRSGLQANDIIVKWGDRWHPTAQECQDMLLEKDDYGQYIHAGRDIEVVVRRIGMDKEIGIDADHPTGTLVSYKILKPLIERRDAIRMEAWDNPQGARQQIMAILKEQTDSEAILQAVQEDLAARASSPQTLDRWLLNLDRETFVVRPESKGMFNPGPPRAGVVFGTHETDRLVVARITGVANDGRAYPAGALKIPRGALITHAGGKPVRAWIDLVDVFRTQAGSDIELRWIHSGVEAKGTIRVPKSLKTVLELKPRAEVVRIADRKRATFRRDGRPVPVTLPYWGAAYEILKENQGNTVPVVYRYGGEEISTTPDGKPLTFEVTEDNCDPWMMRIMYSSMLMHYPETFVLRKSNPLAAMWMGFKKTGNFIIQAYQTMEHIIFTQKVGVENISGPVGIFRIGHSVAQSGWVNLLYFLAFISANLAVINFLPLPIVDGGLFVFLILEKIRGRPVSIKMQVATQIIGLVLIIGIFVFVTFMDVSKWMGEG